MTENKHRPFVQTTVAAIILNSEESKEKILLERRAVPPFKGQWCLPGGHIDRGETALDAVTREVKEEVGLKFEPRFLFYWDEIIPFKHIHAVVLVFSGPTEGVLKAQPGEVEQVQWFDNEEIQAMLLAFQHNGIIQRYFETRDSNKTRHY